VAIIMMSRPFLFFSLLWVAVYLYDRFFVRQSFFFFPPTAKSELEGTPFFPFSFFRIGSSSPPVRFIEGGYQWLSPPVFLGMEMITFFFPFFFSFGRHPR